MKHRRPSRKSIPPLEPQAQLSLAIEGPPSRARPKAAKRQSFRDRTLRRGIAKEEIMDARCR